MRLEDQHAVAFYALVVVEGRVATSLHEIADVPVCGYDLMAGV